MSGSGGNKNQDVWPQAHESVVCRLARIYSVFFGNLALFFAAAFIARSRPSFFSKADLIFWLIVGSLLVARLLDIGLSKGRTLDGTPGTRGDWWRYCATVLAISALVWAIAHAASWSMGRFA